MVFLMCSRLYGTVWKVVSICGATEFLAIRTETSVPRPAEGKKGQGTNIILTFYEFYVNSSHKTILL